MEEPSPQRKKKQGIKRKRGEVILPKGVCVKVASLRPRYNDLKAWREDPDNLLVCRHGRVFIGSGSKKFVYHYPASEWANPYSVKEYGLEKSLAKFKTHLDRILKDEAAKERFLKLVDLKEIGCFCDTKSKCHRDVILCKLEKLINSELDGE